MKKCLFCNYENDDKAVFCSSCGHRLEEPADTKTLSDDEIADGFNPDFGYGKLKEYNAVLFETSKQARQMLDEMPHQAIKKVCIIVESLARDYYREAIYCKTEFSVDELYGKKPPVRITKNISDIIKELDEAQLIPDTIKDVVLGITGTRNIIDYGTAEDISQITRRTADGIYYSGEKATDFFITAVKTEPDRRFKQLEYNYPDLFRKAKDAKKLMDSEDLFATIDELGNLLRGLCSVLFAKYKNMENVRSINYADAIKILCRYNLISSGAQDVIRNIVDNRNMHHNLQEELPYDYVKNAFVLTSRLTVYLLEKINNAPLVRQKTIEFNTKVYNDILNNLFENYKGNINAIKHLNVFQSKDICTKENTSNNAKEINRSAGIYFFVEKEFDENKTYESFYMNRRDNSVRTPYNWYSTQFYVNYPELYSFEDYMKEHYTEIQTYKSDYSMKVDTYYYKNVVSPTQDFYKFTFDIEDLMTISTIYENYKKYRKEQEQAEEQKRQYNESLKKERKIYTLMSILVPIIFSVVILGAIYVTDYLYNKFSFPWNIGQLQIIWIGILYVAMLILSHRCDRLGAGRVICGLLLTIITLITYAFWGLFSICLPGVIALYVWDLVLWILYRNGY